MDNPVAARIAQALRAAMKSQNLSGADLARAVERLTGERPDLMRVSRWTSGSRPLIRISPDLTIACRALGLDPVEVVCDAVQGDGAVPSGPIAPNVHQSPDCTHADVAGERCSACCDTCRRRAHLCMECDEPVDHHMIRCISCDEERVATDTYAGLDT